MEPFLLIFWNHFSLKCPCGECPYFLQELRVITQTLAGCMICLYNPTKATQTPMWETNLPSVLSLPTLIILESNWNIMFMYYQNKPFFFLQIFKKCKIHFLCRLYKNRQRVSQVRLWPINLSISGEKIKTEFHYYLRKLSSGKASADK